MNIEIECRPRIATDIIINVDGIDFFLDDLCGMLNTLDLGDTASADIFPDITIADDLDELGIIERYEEDGVVMASAGKEYDSFKKTIMEACDPHELDFLI